MPLVSYCLGLPSGRDCWEIIFDRLKVQATSVRRSSLFRSLSVRRKRAHGLVLKCGLNVILFRQTAIWFYVATAEFWVVRNLKNHYWSNIRRYGQCYITACVRRPRIETVIQTNRGYIMGDKGGIIVFYRDPPSALEKRFFVIFNFSFNILFKEIVWFVRILMYINILIKLVY